MNEQIKWLVATIALLIALTTIYAVISPYERCVRAGITENKKNDRQNDFDEKLYIGEECKDSTFW
jgi:hypothetical protein